MRLRVEAIRRTDMTPILIATIGIVYLVIAIDLFMNHKLGLGITFLGYALGNVGLFIAAK